MDRNKRYRPRPGAVGFTRGQFAVLAVALVVALGGFVALAVSAWGFAGILLGLAAVTLGFTTFLARGNGEQPPT